MATSEPMHADAAAVVAMAAEHHAELHVLREHGDGAADAGGDRHGQRVVVLDVRQLVRHDAGELVAVQRLQQPGRSANGGVRRIAARGERVGLRAVHDVDARHRQSGALRQLANEAVVLGRRALIDLVRAVHAQHHLVGVPVAEKVHAEGDDEGDDHARLAADQCADRHEDRGQHREQHGRFDVVHDCRSSALKQP